MWCPYALFGRRQFVIGIRQRTGTWQVYRYRYLRLEWQ